MAKLREALELLFFFGHWLFLSFLERLKLMNNCHFKRNHFPEFFLLQYISITNQSPMSKTGQLKIPECSFLLLSTLCQKDLKHVQTLN